MARWEWNINSFPPMHRLVNYYKDEHEVEGKRFAITEDDDTIIWHQEAMKIMSILWTYEEGNHVSIAGGHMADDEYNPNHFVQIHTEEEIKAIAQDLSDNRSQIGEYDDSNPVHKHIIDNIVNGLRMLTYIK